VHALAAGTPCGARLMATGRFGEDDIGVACYHSKTGAVELYLNHLVDQPGEYVVVDCTAGAESFASGLFTRLDLTFLVCEPTRKGVGVWQQWAGYAADYDVPLAVIGNKVLDEEDIAFLREHVGGALLACFGHAPAVRAMEQGRPFSLGDLGQDAQASLTLLRRAADARARDWAKLTRQATEFHLRNAAAWANSAAGEDLAGQVDPGLVVGPQALLVTSGDQAAGDVLALAQRRAAPVASPPSRVTRAGPAATGALTALNACAGCAGASWMKTESCYRLGAWAHRGLAVMTGCGCCWRRRACAGTRPASG